MKRALGLLPLLVLGACAVGPTGDAVATADQALSVPTYRFELRARSSEDPSAPPAYKLPDGAYINDSTPGFNDARDVTLGFATPDDHQHLWKNGVLLHEFTDTEAIISGTSIDAAGNIAFDVVGGASGNGIWRYDAAQGTTAFFSAEPLGASGWINVRLTNDGRVGCRAGTDDGKHFLGFVGRDGFTKIAVDTLSNPNSPYAYLFTPSFDHAGNVALKTTLASGGDEIRVFASGVAIPKTVVQTTAANPASRYAAIDNGVQLGDGGDVVFTAKVGTTRGVYRTNGRTTTTIATEGQGGIAQIDFFTPVVNASGLVAFRGFDTAGNQTIWVGNGISVKKLVAAHDTLPSDRGDLVVVPVTDADSTNRVVFGGGMGMNAKGDVVFSASISERTGATSRSLGTGLYVATAGR